MIDNLFVLLNVVALVYCIFVIFNCLIASKINTRLLIHIFFVLGIYGQIIRLYILNEGFESYIYPTFLFIIGHVIFESAYFVGKKLPRTKKTRIRDIKHKFLEINYNRICFVITTMSIISMLAWYLYFRDMGGVLNYFKEGFFHQRVLLASGKGYYLIIIGFYPIVNYLFFGILLLHKKVNKKLSYPLAFLFLLHTLIWLAMAIPLGSRGALLVMVIIWSIIYRKTIGNIAFYKLILIGLLLLLSLNLLGSLRDSKDLTLKKDDFKTIITNVVRDGWGYEHRISSFSKTINFVPIKVDYQFGKTYLAFFTQFLPRAMFPDKLAGAKEVITKNITREYSYRGTTNDHASMIGEAFLNFGVLGVVIIPVLFGFCAGRVDLKLYYCDDIWSILIFTNLVFVLFFIVQGDFLNSSFAGSIKLGFIILLQKFTTRVKSLKSAEIRQDGRLST